MRRLAWFRISLGRAILVMILALRAGDLVAQSSADCLNCHQDASLTMQKAGKTVYLTTDVPPKYLKRIDVDLSEFPFEKPKVKEEQGDETKPAPTDE